MASLRTREEFFVEDGVLVRRTGRRPSGRGRWPNVRHRGLAVAVEMTDDGIHRVVRGPRHTLEREIEAVTRTYGFFSSEDTPDIGGQVPSRVLDELRNRVEHVTKNVASRYRGLSNEERMTGSLFGQLPEYVPVDEWSIRFHYQGYSSTQKTAKEHRIGADAGIVVEIADGNSSVTKGLWLQAKRVDAEGVPDDVLALPRLRDQMASMTNHTRDAYALIFTPTEVAVTDGTKEWSFADWLIEAARCKRGDRSRAMITNTLDRDYLLEMTIANSR